MPVSCPWKRNLLIHGNHESVRKEVGLLLDERVQELEERRRREAHDVVVVTLDLAHEHPTEPLRADDHRVSASVRSQPKFDASE